jgi:capsular exopolysaccharide synthesis family protein
VQSHNPGYNDPSNPPPPHLPPVHGRADLPPPVGGPAAAPPALVAGPDMGGLLRALGRRWILAVVIGLPLAALAGAAAWYLLAPRYTAVALIRVLYDPDSTFDNRATGSTYFTSLQRSQIGQIRSRPVLTEALKRDEVRRLGLENRYPDAAALAARIEDDLKFETQEGNELITVLMSADDPGEAVTLLRAVTRTYMDTNVYNEKENRKKRVADLSTILTEKDQGLVKKRNRLSAMEQTLGTDRQEKLDALRAELADARRRREALQLESEKNRAILEAENVQTRLPDVAAARDALMRKAEDQDAEAHTFRLRLKRYQDVIKEYERSPRSPEPPTIVYARDKVEELKKGLDERRKELRAQIDAGMAGASENLQAIIERRKLEGAQAALTQHIGRMDAEIEKLVEKVNNFKQKTADMDGLDAEIKTEEGVIAGLRERLEKQRVELQAPDRISLYQEAELQKKDTKKQLMGAAVAPIAVLFVVCMALALGEHRKRKIHHVGEVARGLGIRVVGAVPHLPNLEQKLIGPTGEPELEGHPALESIDALRTLLLREGGANPVRVVLVTSAAAGEGKTTLASHLASSLARAGRKTLLIDGDLRSPAVHQLFELPMQPGFSEVLLAEVESPDAVQPTTIDGLSVMPAGQWDRTVLQALARDGLEGVFEKLRHEFDFLVIDSHPVLAAADSLLLAQKADAVILSVLRQVSQLPRVWAASQRLTSLGVRVLGAVVNAADPNEVFHGAAAPTAAAA